MHIIINLLFICSLAKVFQEAFTYLEFELKPFNCWKCLSFWIGIIAFVITKDYYYISTPYLLTLIIYKYLWS